MHRFKMLDRLGAVQSLWLSHTLSTREIAALQACQSPYVVSFFESWQQDISIEGELATHQFILMELCSSSLRQAIESSHRGMEVERVKSITAQLTSGLAFVHSKDIIHRDLKPENILLTEDGTVKIGDFGMSRPENPARLYTPRVVTLWYRSPELLLGAANYTKAVDLWSVGCIVAELLMGCPLIPAFTEIEMLLGIVKLFGIIDRSVMPAHLDLPLLDSIVLPQEFSVPACRGLEMLDNRDPRALAFIGSLLTVNPDQRLSCAAALFHPFITEDAQACSQRSEVQLQKFSLPFTLPPAAIHLPALPVGQQAFGSFALGGVFVQPAPLHVVYAAEVQVLPTLPVLPMQITGLVKEVPVFPGAAMLPQASYVNPHVQSPIEILARTSHDPYDPVSGSGDSVQASTSTQTASDSNPHQCRSRKEEEDREVIVIEDSSEEGDRDTQNNFREDDVIVIEDSSQEGA